MQFMFPSNILETSHNHEKYGVDLVTLSYVDFGRRPSGVVASITIPNLLEQLGSLVDLGIQPKTRKPREHGIIVNDIVDMDLVASDSRVAAMDGVEASSPGEGIAEQKVPRKSYAAMVTTPAIKGSDLSLAFFEDNIVIPNTDCVVDNSGTFPKIRFSERVHEMIDRSMQRVVIVRLLGRSIGYKTLAYRIPTLWQPQERVDVVTYAYSGQEMSEKLAKSDESVYSSCMVFDKHRRRPSRASVNNVGSPKHGGSWFATLNSVVEEDVTLSSVANQELSNVHNHKKKGKLPARDLTPSHVDAMFQVEPQFSSRKCNSSSLGFMVDKRASSTIVQPKNPLTDIPNVPNKMGGKVSVIPMIDGSVAHVRTHGLMIAASFHKAVSIVEGKHENQIITWLRGSNQSGKGTTSVKGVHKKNLKMSKKNDSCVPP
ncbi:hypothetical protein V6N12_045544 [Hibiscus sabdariffa]|uniref:Uncharacterized protein n=1 Tax=Hibiscus sabdariffa TaxID=183260 RepID=A0ABR2G3N6_9ROSI